MNWKIIKFRKTGFNSVKIDDVFDELFFKESNPFEFQFNYSAPRIIWSATDCDILFNLFELQKIWMIFGIKKT